MESSSLQELEQIPGVGKTIAQDIGRNGRIRNNLLLTCRQKQLGCLGSTRLGGSPGRKLGRES